MFNAALLKDLRVAAGESQSQVAALLNVTQQAYANYESGKRKPDITTISKLAQHFGVMIESFFADEENKTASPQADGVLMSKLTALSPVLREQFVRFLALAKEDPDKAARFLEFAAQELEDRK